MPPGRPSPVSASSAACWKSPGLRGWSWTPASTCPAPASCPRSAGRTAYRVVQEGLTNARKHAPGAPVEVSVTCNGEAGLVVEVISGAVTAAPGVPPLAGAGSGTGLIGLAERLALAGGDLEHRTTADGEFVLRAMLPGQR